jgi:lysozyme
MKTNAAGLALLKRWEGCRLEAYPDPATKDDPAKKGAPWTIGWGHTEDVHPGQRITQHQADVMLQSDLECVYEPAVEEACRGVPLTDNQFSALVCLTYNIGAKNLRRSEVLRSLKRGDFQTAANAFRAWRRANGRRNAGLIARREDERALFLSQPPPALRSA